jgi:Na+-driven multidrug efflux pump
MILGNTFVALGDSRMPVRINLWTSAIAITVNVVFIRAWGFMGAAWASLVWNFFGWVITEAVLSRRIRPAGRGYLWTLVLLAAILVAGLRAGLAVRLFLIAFAVAASLVTSPTLRADVLQVWRTQIRSRPGRKTVVRSGP